MTERKLNPVDQAYQEMPEVWYEKLGYKGMYLVMMTTCLLTILTYKDALKIESLESHLVGALLYTIGSIADIVSTGRTLDAGIKVAEAGVRDYTFVEGHPLLDKVRSSSELYRSSHDWMLEGLGLIVGTAIAPLGIAGGFARACAAMNNFRKTRRANRIVELALSEEFHQLS